MHTHVGGIPSSAVFRDRADAGRRLGQQLARLRTERPIVLGLPRGGVAVAAEVARELEAPLDVALVRKLGVPYQPELAMGAIGEGGVRVVNEEVRRAAGVTERDLALVEARERAELGRQVRVYREGLPPLDVAGRTVVIVDDGIATGSTARAACQIARARGVARVVLATPVAPAATLSLLAAAADEVVAVQSPEPFFAIGQWYEDFAQLGDAQVVSLLRALATRTPGGGEGRVERTVEGQIARTVGGRVDGTVEAEVEVDVGGGLRLPGSLVVPRGARAVVVFAHGSGSSRSSPRNRRVAAHLWRAGFGTLLFDLLRPEEADDRARVFDIALLGGRLAAAASWLGSSPETGDLHLGAMGASTGAAAALWAAAMPSSPIRAVVSRGGRPDLAGELLGRVTCPTLLIVGELDTVVLDLNRRALRALGGVARLVVVPGAAHLFEEPGALDIVAGHAAAWFGLHLVPGRRAPDDAAPTPLVTRPPPSTAPTGAAPA